MIISISGVAGSGKSTVAEKLAQKLNWPHYYIGQIRRELAKEHGMTLAEYNKFGENNPSTDIEVDEYQKKLGREKDNFIIQGRTSWYFIPNSLKIYLDVEERVGAERVFHELSDKNNRNEDNNLNSIDQVLKSHRKRKKSDQIRYKKYYKIDAYDKSNYDYVLDTTNLDKKQVFTNIYDFVKNKLDIEAKQKKG